MLRTYHVEPVRVLRPRSEHALSVWFALGYWASDKKSASDRHSLFALFKCQHKKAQSRAGSAWVCLYLSVLTTVLLALLQRRWPKVVRQRSRRLLVQASGRLLGHALLNRPADRKSVVRGRGV